MFAKEKDRTLEGILVVRRDSPYRHLAQLRGAVIAFPAPAAFAASVLTQSHLRRLRIPYTAKYVLSHDSVYLAVAQGLYPAGGGIPRTFENMPADVRESLRILWRTPAYTPHAIAVPPRVPQGVVRVLRRAMIDMDRDPGGQVLLRALGFRGLAEATDSEYDDIRALNIRLLDELIEK